LPFAVSLQLDGTSSWEASQLRSPLDNEDYRPRLSGHETFPLRYGWLRKSFAATCEERRSDREIFSADSAIAWFGVGKNMVSSMRHWALTTRILTEDDRNRTLKPTPIGTMLFDDVEGLDPWMEHPSSSWLAHWHISGYPRLTTWFWAFSHYPGIAFERDMIVRGVKDLADQHGWPRASVATIKRDVACLVRSYAPVRSGGAAAVEDSLESPLAELGLIRSTGRRDGFRFVRGPKPTLLPGVFSYALGEFWHRFAPESNTLSFEALAHAPGSPGRVFLLGENDLVQLLVQLDNVTQGAYQWSESAGLRQLIRVQEVPSAEAVEFVRSDYLGRYK
jgi:hypothetical protein